MWLSLMGLVVGSYVPFRVRVDGTLLVGVDGRRLCAFQLGGYW
jgi:hypothetical protein